MTRPRLRCLKGSTGAATASTRRATIGMEERPSKVLLRRDDLAPRDGFVLVRSHDVSQECAEKIFSKRVDKIGVHSPRQ